MQYPQITLGMIAIFFYVGVEVAIGSNLGELLKQDNFGGYGSSDIAPFIAMFWGVPRVILNLSIPTLGLILIFGVMNLPFMQPTQENHHRVSGTT